MPPSHNVSRTVLALLVAALVAGVLVAGADPQFWHGVNDQAQELWAMLRATANSTTDTAAPR